MSSQAGVLTCFSIFVRTFSTIISKYTLNKLNKTKGTTKGNFVKTDLEYWPDKALSGSLRQFEV